MGAVSLRLPDDVAQRLQSLAEFHASGETAVALKDLVSELDLKG